MAVIQSPFGAEPTVAITPSGDTTGAVDAKTINAAVAKLPATGGVITWAPSATWNLLGGQVVVSRGTNVWFDMTGCYVKGVGSGDLVRFYDSSTYSTRVPQAGGGIIGQPTFDGSNMTGNCCAVHCGDILWLNMFAQARNFNTGSTSKGFWFDNNYFWTEQLYGRVHGQSCTTNIMFDNSTGTSLSAAATGSFERANIDCYVENNAVGDGVTFTNGATMIGQALRIMGNFAGNGATSYSVLRITGSNALGSSGLGYVGRVEIDVELDSVGGTIPKTITFGSGANFMRSTGYCNFAGTANVFGATNAAGNFQQMGPAFGDGALNPLVSLGSVPFQQTLSGNGQTIFTGTLGNNELQASAAFTGLILAAGTINGQIFTLINSSGNTQTFAAAGTSNVADGVSDAPVTAAARTYVWNSRNSLWYRWG